MRIRTALAAAVLAAAGLFATTGSASADTDVAILSGFNDNPCITVDTVTAFDEPVSTTIQSANCG
ncbi:hypothetical protein ACFVVA_00985 [Kitasatospora sp. NPDC058048]|uniref:hypothetical protein n=1 Tax=Kitasatospora sp. NPDC058048 TaxID=3346313 RepID=UPI0036D85F7A